MTVRCARGLTQSAKAGGVAGEERALNDIATEVVAAMCPGALYILGPGTTTRTVMERLGLPKTLLGVDAVRDGALAGADLAERDLLALAGEPSDTFVVVTVIGGQGHSGGATRISPAVWGRAGPGTPPWSSSRRRRSRAPASRGTPGRCSSTPGTRPDEAACGYVKVVVVTALGERTMYKVGSQSL